MMYKKTYRDIVLTAQPVVTGNDMELEDDWLTFQEQITSHFKQEFPQATLTWYANHAVVDYYRRRLTIQFSLDSENIRVATSWHFALPPPDLATGIVQIQEAIVDRVNAVASYNRGEVLGTVYRDGI